MTRRDKTLSSNAKRGMRALAGANRVTERSMAAACRFGQKEFTRDVFNLVTHETAIRHALDRVVRQDQLLVGAKLANCIRDLDDSAQFMSHLLRQEECDLTHLDRATIKNGNRSQRIGIPSIWDRAVGQAIVDVVSPYLTALTAKSSDVWPCSDRSDALATVRRLASSAEKWILLPVTVKNPFRAVPRKSALSLLMRQLPNARLLAMVEQLVPELKTGLLVTQPASRLLAETYVGALLSTVSFPATVVRVLGHMLIMARTGHEALETECQLRSALSTGELRTKRALEGPVDIRQRRVNWLSVGVGIAGGRFHATPVDAPFNLADEIHLGPVSPVPHSMAQMAS